LYNRPWCRVVSKAFSISKNISAVDMLLSKFEVAWSVNFMHCSAVLCWARKPNWLALRKSLTSVWLWTIFRIIFSKSLAVVAKRLIGRTFWRNFGSLPRFGKVMIFASFQGFGKCNNWRQWLNKCVKYISGILRRCLRRSFGIPSVQQTYLSFSYCINFCISQGLTFSKGVSFAASSSAWTPPPLAFYGFVTQVMRCELNF
jgi:hypothetical protein